MQTERCATGYQRVRRNTIFGLLLSIIIPAACLGQTHEPLETIRVESDLVDLKVSVVSLNSQSPFPKLQQSDFLVREDGARSVTVEIQDRRDLTARTREGYYSKSLAN